MEFLLIGVAIVAILGALLFLAIKCMDERFYEGGWLWTTLFAIFLVLGVAGIAYSYDQEEKACEAEGGQMVKVGEYTTYIKSGSVMIPSTSSDYDCVKISTEQSS